MRFRGTEHWEINMKPTYDELYKLVNKLAQPKIHAPDYNEWFHGDGPAEEWFDQLVEEARNLLGISDD